MDEREKIVNIIQSAKYCDTNNRCDECKYDKELDDYRDMSCGSLKAADALLAAGIGDVTEWKERAEKAENALKEGVKCISSSPTSGFTINPIDVLRDSTKCITIAQRALENIIKQYWCDERGCNECEEKQGCIEGICSRYIQQAEREIEEEKR